MNLVEKVLNTFGYTKKVEEPKKPDADIVENAPVELKTEKPKPAISRSTEPAEDTPLSSFSYLNGSRKLVYPGFQFDVIPIIRDLTICNADISQALHNIVHLGNTGHKIRFDTAVSPEMADKMREHIKIAAAGWMDGITSVHGVTNKLFRQVMIAGANAFEVIANPQLNGVYRVLLVKPEDIRFEYSKAKMKYIPYQYVSKGITSKGVFTNLKELNQDSFRYIALNGDTELPYGNPPYLPALPPIEDQKEMLANIRFIIRQVGALGFLELLVDKPDQKEGESDSKYLLRLDQFLKECKANVSEGMKEGVVTGYKDDHEFKFNSATKNVSGVEALFGLNETQVASGVKSDPALMGKGSKGAESHITILFTKLIAELDNIQLTVAECLKFIYSMELRLAGYSFKTLEVVFKPSTVQDELKLQQGLEIKIRNLRTLYADGIIGQEQYAEEMDYEEPDQQEPRVPLVQTDDPMGAEQKRVKREKGKDASDRKGRAKSKPQDKKAYK